MIWLLVMFDVVGMVLTGGELTFFEVVGLGGLIFVCCVARCWLGMFGVT